MTFEKLEETIRKMIVAEMPEGANLVMMSDTEQIRAFERLRIEIRTRPSRFRGAKLPAPGGVR